MCCHVLLCVLSCDLVHVVVCADTCFHFMATYNSLLPSFNKVHKFTAWGRRSSISLSRTPFTYMILYTHACTHTHTRTCTHPGQTHNRPPAHCCSQGAPIHQNPSHERLNNLQQFKTVTCLEKLTEIEVWGAR